MKNVYYLIIALPIFLASCGGAEEEAIPATVEGKQELLKAKRGELRELSKEVEALEQAIFTQNPKLAPKGTLVAAQAISTSSFEDFANVQATVVASETAMATPEIPGRIVSMRFEEGDPIRRGQLVATIDVESVSTQRAELETAGELAKTVYERQQRLWDQKIGSELQFLQAKNNFDRIQQQLKSIDVQAAKKNVYAPISGTVDRIMMRQGEAAMPGAPILSILNTNDLDVVADASEDLLTKIKQGQTVRIKVPNAAVEFEAPVTRIGKTVDPANRTFEVEVKVPAKYRNQLKANLLAEVEILNFEAADIIVVSQDRIQQEIDGRRYVFVVSEEDGETIARKKYIETGESYNNNAIITSGLIVGDRIITDGSRGLTDGQKISLG
ncbi:efflux RND transporter periplasmic adaptor subunit [Neolewinella antarctica]|uniref:RND family efflux transporter MFP subunit n=1 Tax=Neolewinella antarctica TaxID=442734 RepID=A0ABX0X9U3_9BACT|nr:efflux RND transporter periplasmic adaptor subunit [Neolewinella antarctica]NJC25729.1 RND family efflux transporter MFP subunit [Neolewinella antarctica]